MVHGHLRWSVLPPRSSSAGCGLSCAHSGHGPIAPATALTASRARKVTALAATTRNARLRCEISITATFCTNPSHHFDLLPLQSSQLLLRNGYWIDPSHELVREDTVLYVCPMKGEFVILFTVAILCTVRTFRAKSCSQFDLLPLLSLKDSCIPRNSQPMCCPRVGSCTTPCNATGPDPNDSIDNARVVRWQPLVECRCVF